ncbi:dienelactone hydrolase family protein [Xylogone sp. PMI_703]|nr:dienelactone hydrolase family protein [Xylogone sp. PMI_703]
MTSNPPSAECCITGFEHEGSPRGEMQTIEGVETYIASPKSKVRDKAILILSDAVGIYNNSKLLADNFADRGYLTLIPDLFDDDAVPIKSRLEKGFDLSSWLAKHPIENVDVIVQKFIDYLKTIVKTKFIGGVGYCFGGKYVARFLNPEQIKVGFTAHPSFVTREELGNIKGPLSIAAAEIDDIFTRSLCHESENILQKIGISYQISLFSGVSHGFAVRGDLSVSLDKFAKEQAFRQAVAWFDLHLQK